MIFSVSPSTIYRRLKDALFQSKGLPAWNQITKQHLLGYASWLNGEQYSYSTEYFELTTIKQAMNHMIESKAIPSQCDFTLGLPSPAEKGSEVVLFQSIPA